VVESQHRPRGEVWIDDGNVGDFQHLGGKSMVFKVVMVTIFAA
jgi:hypothetical protein